MAWMWKCLAGRNEDANAGGILAALHYTEQVFVRMFHGMVLFFRESMPELLQRIVTWLRSVMEHSVRVLIRLGRVTGLALAWLAVVFAPLSLYPGLITIGWMGVTLLGSIYGLRREIKARGKRHEIELSAELPLNHAEL